MENTETAQKYHLLLKLDPISHLVLMWHTSRFSGANARIHMLPLTFDLYTSILYFLVAGVLITLIGGLIVKKKEIMISDMELEGI